MLQRVSKALSFANIVSMLALLLAMGGTGYALSIPKNSVGSQQIKNNSVKAADVKDGSLLSGDFKAGQLPAGPQGAPGAQGPRGLPGIQGPTGSTGAATTAFFQASADLANGANQSYGVFCPAGKQAIGGGGRGDDTLSEETILTNTRPAISAGNTEPPLAGQGFTGWRITVVNPIGGAASGVRPEVWVVCVDA